MTGSRFLPLALSFALAVSASHAQSAPAVVITPAVVVAGSPELIRVDGPATASLTGEWLGRKLEFFRGKSGRSWFALAGVDVEQAPGPSQLAIHATFPSGGPALSWNRDIEIHPARYRTESLSVSSGFVEPDASQQKQIADDGDIKAKAYATSAPQPLWHGNFRLPVPSRPTDSFGTRRMFNGKLAAIHKGMDFHAPKGTVVQAANSGIVVLARPLYYEGNCVIIDHGLGLYTLSMHFSRIDVKEGQRVKTGDRLGLSGATGRVTGPHLHWAVRWQGAFLDPAKVLRLNLAAIR